MIIDSMASSGVNKTRNMTGRKNDKSTTKREVVQWKERNVEQGVVIVNEEQLLKLIKNEPIEKYYSFDPEPFATGMFASVRRCKSITTGEVLAAKFSSRTRYGEDCTKEIHHEIALLSLCSPSPRIVKLHDVFQTEKELIIVMEYAPGGDMQTIIDDNLVPFESDVIKFTQQLVEGLAYLHHRKIAHLDIKPQNIVMMGDFPNCDIKVCDFEISRVILEGVEIRELLGTPDYVAPEILHYEPITLAADMWSLGVTIYVLLTGFSPFGGETDTETFRNISKAHLEFPDELFEDVSTEAKDFVARLLIKNPKDRMTAKECLKHPWLMNKKQIMTRVGCSSCPSIIQNQQNKKNLRKYLSKSREALFEKVISASKIQQQENLRKSALLKYNKMRRLCESQMSLVSKAREKTLGEMSISLGRSREKLYGLKSLSKSQEVLNLYKSMKEINNICINEIIMNIQQLNKCENKPNETETQDTHETKAQSDIHNSFDCKNKENELIEDKQNNVQNDELGDKDTRSVSPESKCDRSRSIRSPDKFIRQCSHEGNEKPRQNSSENLKKQDSSKDIKHQNSNDAIIKGRTSRGDNTEQRDKKTNNESNKINSNIKKNDTNNRKVSVEERYETNVRRNSREEKEKISTRKTSMEEKEINIRKLSREERVDKDSTNKRKTSKEESNAISIRKNSREERNDVVRKISNIEKEETLSHTSSENGSSEEDSLEYVPGVYDEDFDEPRFSVAQLISAYNKHEEIAKKIIRPTTVTKFPIGPNALRLFIPNIDITSKKLATRKKTFIVRNHSILDTINQRSPFCNN